MCNSKEECEVGDKTSKIKARVADHGEVFTAEREVKAMCDLVKQETERIDSRIFGTSLGDGNFLAEILNRKLFIVSVRYKKSFMIGSVILCLLWQLVWSRYPF